MINRVVEILTTAIISIISSTSYGGVFALMTAESALIPIPSEITMTFSGYLASTGRFSFWLVVLTGAFANLFGSWLAYWLGYWGEESFVRKFIRSYGKYLLVSEDDYTKSEKWYRKYGQSFTFFSRILPIVRTFISLPAGIAHMDFMKFSIFTFVGSFIWCTFLTYIGFYLGKNWNSLHVYYQRFEYVILFAFVCLAAYYIVHKLKKISRKSHS